MPGRLTKSCCSWPAAFSSFIPIRTGSPICQQAVDACLKALVALESRDTLSFRVSPNALVVDETSVGAGTLIEQELARRLHQASIAQVTIERAVSPRELARFCADLVRCGDRSAHRVALTELLTEHGVKRIALRAAYRPEVLSVPAGDRTGAGTDRSRADAARGPVLGRRSGQSPVPSRQGLGARRSAVRHSAPCR